jgi:hypothetical protein
VVQDQEVNRLHRVILCVSVPDVLVVVVIYFFHKSFTRYGNSHINNNKKSTS